MSIDSKHVFIAQISDLHVMLPGKRAFDVIDTAAHLSRCVKHILGLRPRPAAVIASGDLADEGSEAEYQRLRELLAPLESPPGMPVYLMPGNHDRRTALRAVFAQHRYFDAADGTLNFALQFGVLRVLALDTLVENEPHGALDDIQIAWLDAALRMAPDQPALLFMHHPPVASGMALMDRIGLAPESARKLEGVVRAHRQVLHIGCGHVHRPIKTSWADTPVSICPSTAFQAALAFDGGEWCPAMGEPPGYQLYHWNGSQLATHTIAVQS
jgi:3',5'-cyclic AMP phosphodiesterase CpdA